MTDALIYPGRLNALNGEPGGGKTWVALHTCAEAVQSGYHALYIDLPEGPVTGRWSIPGTRWHSFGPAKPGAHLYFDFVWCMRRAHR